MIKSVLAAATLPFAQYVRAELPLLSEKDSIAKALGYKADAKCVDKKKYPKYASGQNCNECISFSATASDDIGNCSQLSDRLVSAKGWCCAFEG